MRSYSTANAGWPLVAALVLLGLGLSQTRGAASELGLSSGQIGLGQQPQPHAAFGTADSNGAMIAVTGLDVTGASILYLVDTERRQLSVYQATGGTDSMMNVRWVGARKIDLDLRVDGFNDKSQYSYKDLAEEFAASASGGVTPGAEPAREND